MGILDSVYMRRPPLRKHFVSSKHPHIRILKYEMKTAFNGCGRWACHGPWMWAYGHTQREAWENFQAAVERARSD